MRELTEEEKASVTRFREITEAERIQLIPQSGISGQVTKPLPPSVREIVSKSPPGKAAGELASRVGDRFMGSDIDDQMALARLVPTIAGGIGGAIGGAKAGAMGGPVGIAAGGITGAVVGATAGALTPEPTLSFLESLNLIPEGTRDRIGLSGAEQRRLAEGEALLELTTLGIAGGVRAVGRATGRISSGVTSETERIAEEAAEMGIELSPTQTGAREFGRTVLNVLGRMPFMGKPARVRLEASERAFQRIHSELPTRVATITTDSELGVRIFREAETLYKSQFGKGGTFDKMYSAVFRAADDAGATINPRHTSDIADTTLTALNARVPRGTKEGADATELVRNFLKDDISKLQSGQTLQQMDEVISKIDQLASRADMEIRSEVARLLEPIKVAAKRDVTENIFLPSGEKATEIGLRLADVDAQFSSTLRHLFETATAKEFGAVRRQGIRGTVRPSQETTRQQADKLYKIVRDLDSPQAITELARLVPPETMRLVAANTLEDILVKSVKREGIDGFRTFDPKTFKQLIGLDRAGSPKYQVMENLLKGSELSMKDLKKIAAAADSIGTFSMPDVSAFVARSAQLRATQGLSSKVITGLLPFGVAAGGAGAAGFGGGALSLFLFYGAGRSLIDAVSNPASARALKNVMNEEMTNVRRHGELMKLIRMSAVGLQGASDVAREHIPELMELARSQANDLFGIEQE